MSRTWISLLLLTACTNQCRVHPRDSNDTVVPGETAGETAEAGDTSDTSDPGPATDGACGTGDGPGLSPQAQTVVVLVTDGARIDETFGDMVSSVTGEPTEDFWPTIRTELLPEGTLVLPGLATGVTITAEGHAALLTGSRVAQANFPSDDGPGMYRPELPTLFERLRAEFDLPAESTALVGNTVHLGGHGWSLHPGHGEPWGASYNVFTQENGQPVGSDTEVINGVRAQMEQHDTRIVVANLHQMDRAGHYNASPTAYAEGVKNVDQAIVDFWNWIQQSAIYANRTALVIVADHGRHRWNESEDYRHHGDQCTGCRQIPMFIAGPGIRKGHEVSATYTIEDVGKTIAWLMDIDLPHAEGQILCEAMNDTPFSNGREGVGDLAMTEQVRAEMQFGDSPETKSQVVADDILLSASDAIHAEAPRAWTTQSDDYVCWRELGPGPSSLDSIQIWPWEARCVHRRIGSGDFTEITMPLDQISPYWAPAMSSDGDGNLLLAYADNYSGNWEAPDQAIRLLMYTPTGWQGMGFGIGAAYPLEPSLALYDPPEEESWASDTAWVAFSASNDQTDSADKKAGRFLRHIEVWRADISRNDANLWTSPEWTQEYRNFTLHDQSVTEPDPWDRMERPSLFVDATGIQVAFVAISAANGNTVGWATGDSDGVWSTAIGLDDGGQVLAHITPQFAADGRVSWLRRSSTSDSVELCAWKSGVEDRLCIDTGWPFTRGLSIVGEVATILVSDGDGAWQTEDLPLPPVQ